MTPERKMRGKSMNFPTPERLKEIKERAEKCPCQVCDDKRQLLAYITHLEEELKGWIEYPVLDGELENWAFQHFDFLDLSEKQALKILNEKAKRAIEFERRAIAAEARISHLEKYKQHLPKCQKFSISNRVAFGIKDFYDEAPCTCGLEGGSSIGGPCGGFLRGADATSCANCGFGLYEHPRDIGAH